MILHDSETFVEPPYSNILTVQFYHISGRAIVAEEKNGHGRGTHDLSSDLKDAISHILPEEPLL